MYLTPESEPGTKVIYRFGMSEFVGMYLGTEDQFKHNGDKKFAVVQLNTKNVHEIKHVDKLGVVHEDWMILSHDWFTIDGPWGKDLVAGKPVETNPYGKGILVGRTNDIAVSRSIGIERWGAVYKSHYEDEWIVDLGDGNNNSNWQDVLGLDHKNWVSLKSSEIMLI